MLVYGKYECFVMQMLYMCGLCASCGSSQCCILHDFHMCGIMFLLRAVLNILVTNASPRGPMCFRCLIFNL